MVLAHRRAVVHGVERRDLVDSHGRHLEEARDLVHDAQAGESVLALAEVEDGHDGGLLVLRRVPGQDLFDEHIVLLGEFEGDAGVVVGGVAVLGSVSAAARRSAWHVDVRQGNGWRARAAEGAHTTARESLATLGEAPKALRCERTAGRAATHNRLAAEPKMYGVILEAIGVV